MRCRALQPIAENEASHPVERLHFSCLSHLEALAISKGQNKDQSVNQDIFFEV